MRKFLIRTFCLALVLLALVAGPTISSELPLAKQVTNSKVNIPVETVQVSASETTIEPKNTVVDSIVAKEDDRAEKLAAYFAVKNSPFVNVASDFITVADKYDIDWTLLPAITGVESSFGLHVPAFSYNPYGWNNGHYHFQNWVDAANEVALGLRTRYAPTGVITAARIGKMYAANPTWASRVYKYQQEIALFAGK